MREIEVKAKIENKENLQQALEKMQVVLSEPITQQDHVWGLPDIDGTDAANRAPWLRIRTEIKPGETRCIFTFKKSITNQLDSIEHETEVGDESEMIQIIEQLGFVSYANVVKIRQKAKFGDIEICIDTVEGLGDFMEAEKMTNDTVDYDEVRKELWGLLQTIGIKRSDEVTDGYDTMMRRKQGLAI